MMITFRGRVTLASALALAETNLFLLDRTDFGSVRGDGVQSLLLTELALFAASYVALCAVALALAWWQGDPANPPSGARLATVNREL